MKFKFECPYCGQRISATADQVNTIGVCPACQKDVTVPAPPAPVAFPEAAPTAPMPAPAAAIVPPLLMPDVPPAMTPPQRPPAQPTRPPAAPVRPATRAVPPAPRPRPAPVPSPPVADEPWEVETRPPGLPIFALLLCLLPIPGLILLRIAGLGNIASFGKLLAGAACVCLLGIILAHRAWWRSKARLSARVFSFISLLLGYGSAFVIGFMVVALDAGSPVVAKRIEAVPDVKPEGGDLALTKPEPPDATPKAPEIAKIEPPEKPMTGEPAKPEPTAPPPPPVTASTAAAGEGDQAQFFLSKIHPILSDKCYKCHSEQTGKSKGGLTLDTRDALLKGGETGPGIKPGDPDASLLIKAVLYTDDNLQMPPKGDRLTNNEVADLTAWVKMGAPYAAKAK